VDFLFVIIELFRYFIRLRRYKPKSLSANFRCKGRRPSITVGVSKLEWLPFHVVSKYPQLFGFVTKHVCDRRTDGRTDWRTDRRTELRLARLR